VGVSSVNLTWAMNDTASSSYTYRIEVTDVRNGTLVRNVTSSVPQFEITGLIPGTWYNFTVFAAANDSQPEGEGASIDLYTSKSQPYFWWTEFCWAIVLLPFTGPSPVHALEAEYVGVTSVNLTWATNDTASISYTYRIQVANATTSVQDLTSNDTRSEITDLIPGTWYNFTIVLLPFTGPSPVHALEAEYVGVTSVNLTWAMNDTASISYTYRIEVANATTSKCGCGSSFFIFLALQIIVLPFTGPSPVRDLKVEYVGVTSVNLTWAVSDAASSSYTYRIEVANATTSVWNLTSNDIKFQITDLIPGTLYNFTVFAAVNDSQTEGEGATIDLYTRPSPVHALEAEYVGVTSVNLTWAMNDTASISYTYRIEVANATTSVQDLMSNDTRSEITDLIPGTWYNFTVFSAVNDRPLPVNSFQCEPVANQSVLMLKWECPFGNSSDFKIFICKDKCEVQQTPSSCMEEGSEQTIPTAPLEYFSTYNVTIVTLSNTSQSSAVQKMCNTSITDPPVPTEAPLVKAISHSSLSVQFSNFDSNHGPLKAYAVMITTEEQDCKSLKSKLSNTYQEFKKKMVFTYVTYVVDPEQAKSPYFHSQNGTNIINVGKGNTTYGYENGPLFPLHSYRASVAGFTNITFTMDNIIVGEDSYVSFSPCSEAVLLPQDPGVIAGAVIGCLLAILAVVTIGGFIIWRRRRKDKRNTEVSFSPIKSKMIKVENFESYFKKQQADSNCGFAEEYEELKSAGVHQPKFAAELPDNRGKNRYNNVLPYDISRVKLSEQNCATADYINANYMPGYNSKKAFIAAQGPLPNTIDDFWRMIWEKNIYSIVMLTKCVEQARTKCEQYWPDKQSKSYGDIIVTMVSEIALPEWTIRDFTVEKSNTTESHTVRQFHFTSWPDHGVPETTDLLINFRHLVHEYSSQNPIDSPTLVHCSAGVGRTGTFIAIDRLIQQIEMENTVDVYGVIYDLRMHRPLMVQTEDQYVFLNQCVMDIIRSQKEKKTDLIYQNTTAMAIYENFTPEPGFGKANGYHT
uniref:Receptor-type tyrosine-protein phosphatase eta n=1 Tax=Calidris pygmaea TaxID=425635 RepID=A0A8C3J4T8_9CHAR